MIVIGCVCCLCFGSIVVVGTRCSIVMIYSNCYCCRYCFCCCFCLYCLCLSSVCRLSLTFPCTAWTVSTVPCVLFRVPAAKSNWSSRTGSRSDRTASSSPRSLSCPSPPAVPISISHPCTVISTH